MANDSITYTMTGEVSKEAFVAAVADLSALIDALAGEIVGKNAAPRWVVEFLEAGSATMTFAPVGDDVEEAAAEIVQGYATVGRSLERDDPLPYSQKVETAARRLTSVLDGVISAVRFETPEETATVLSATEAIEGPKLFQAYGAVEGRVQTLTSHGGLRFVLYDSVFKRAVRCYLEPGSEELLRRAWDKRASVEGWVSRDPLSGRPVAVRRVTTVNLLGEIEPGAYRRARGALPLAEGEPPPEDAVRRLRDAS